MRVHFTTSTPELSQEAQLLPSASPNELSAALTAAGHRRFSVAKDPADADAIIYVEPQHLGRLRTFRGKLLAQELIRKYPNKCFTFDYTPEPVGFLPGVYVHMPARKWDIHRFRSGGYLRTFNPLVDTYELRRETPTEYLYSFRGAMSHPVRRSLFEAGIASPSCPIEQSSTFGGADDAERTHYFDQMILTKFVLCPRGWGTSSIRMYEAMQLGRVPVVIADEWVPPAGPSWSRFIIRIAESRLTDIPTILKDREDDFDAMAAAARQAWDEWFSPSVRLIHTLEAIEDLLLTRPTTHDEARCRRQWTTFGYEWVNGISMPQSVFWLARNGMLATRGKDHIMARLAALASVQQTKTNG